MPPLPPRGAPREPWEAQNYIGPELDELEYLTNDHAHARMIYEALRWAPPEIAGLGALIVFIARNRALEQ